MVTDWALILVCRHGQPETTSLSKKSTCFVAVPLPLCIIEVLHERLMFHFIKYLPTIYWPYVREFAWWQTLYSSPFQDDSAISMVLCRFTKTFQEPRFCLCCLCYWHQYHIYVLLKWFSGMSFSWLFCGIPWKTSGFLSQVRFIWQYCLQMFSKCRDTFHMETLLVRSYYNIKRLFPCFFCLFFVRIICWSS